MSYETEELNKYYSQYALTQAKIQARLRDLEKEREELLKVLPKAPGVMWKRKNLRKLKTCLKLVEELLEDKSTFSRLHQTLRGAKSYLDDAKKMWQDYVPPSAAVQFAEYNSKSDEEPKGDLLSATKLLQECQSYQMYSDKFVEGCRRYLETKGKLTPKQLYVLGEKVKDAKARIAKKYQTADGQTARFVGGAACGGGEMATEQFFSNYGNDEWEHAMDESW